MFVVPGLLSCDVYECLKGSLSAPEFATEGLGT